MAALFETSEINGMVLSNRFIRSATWAGMATDINCRDFVENGLTLEDSVQVARMLEKTSDRSPSFPLGSQDPLKVTQAIADLLKKHANLHK